MNSFGAKLKSCRKDMSLSQKELGQKIGVAESTISLYESNKRFPDAETLHKNIIFIQCFFGLFARQFYIKRDSRL